MFFFKLEQQIVFYIALILSYALLVSVVGFFRAWIALKMGDDTAQEQGFLTFNPMVHVDLLGFIFLLLFHIGWGRQIPINLANIHGPWRWLKIATAMLSGVFIYLFIAFVGLIRFITIFQNNLAPKEIYVLSTTSILTIFISLCLFLAVIELIMNSVLLGILFLVEKNQDFMEYAFYAVLIVPMIIFLLFGTEIKMLFAHVMSSLASALMHLLCRT